MKRSERPFAAIAVALAVGVLAASPASVVAQTTVTPEGGLYRVLKKKGGGEVHHMPSQNSWKRSTNDFDGVECGPGIRMDPEDHRKTGNSGRGTRPTGNGELKSVDEFRDEERALLDSPDRLAGIEAAMRKNVDNIMALQRAGLFFSGLDYTAAIQQMWDAWNEIRDVYYNLDIDCRPPWHPQYSGAWNTSTQGARSPVMADEDEPTQPEPAPAPAPAPEPTYYWEPEGEWHADGSMC